jgi:hypothetical protein
MRNSECGINTQKYFADSPLPTEVSGPDHGVHAAESEVAEALSKGYNSVAVTRADHDDQFPVPIPHSAFRIPNYR